MQKPNTYIGLLLCLAQTLSTVPVATAQSTVSVSVADTIAGVGTHAQINGSVVGEPLLVLLPPYGAEVLIEPQVSDSEITGFIPGGELEDAGTYELLLELDGSPTNISTQFEVLADTVDPANSVLQSDRNFLEANGSDTVTVDAILRDRFGNTVPQRAVQLISGRASDKITNLSFETDENGKQSFSVSASQSGPITLRAIDLISGKVLDSQLEIGTGMFTAAAGGPVNGYLSPTAQYAPSQYASPFVGNLLGNQQQPAQPVAQIPVAQPTLPPLYGSADTRAAIAPTSNQFAPQAQSYGSPFGASLLAGQKLYGQLGTFDVIDRFIIETEDEIKANFDENLTITAVDRNGRVVEDYTGKALLSSTDPSAVLPSFGEVTFRGSDLGQKTLVLGMRFSTPGQHLLLAQDSADSNVKGSTVINVIGETYDGEKGLITIDEPKDGTLINTDTVIVKGYGPPFVNINVTGGEVDVSGDTDQEGGFAIQVVLDSEKVDHTLRVRDQSGRFDSGNISIKSDTTPPEVSTLTFTPAEPKEGDDILVEVGVVEAGPQLQKITLSYNEQEYEMAPSENVNEGDNFSFRATVPAEAAGQYQPVIMLTDLAGNTAETRGTIDVARRGLERVENLEAEPSINHIRLSWDPLEEEVDGYRVYVYENQDEDYLYTIDVDGPVTSVDAVNLLPSYPYSFRIKALEGDRESEEFSDRVSTSTLGMELAIVEADSQLTLEWTRLQDSIPLQNYILDFGINENNLDNQITLSGEMNIYVLSDLINELTYYVKITPITVTGERMEDLSAAGQGTPNSSVAGFSVYPGEKVPKDLLGTTITLHSGAADPIPPIETVIELPEEQPETGLPFSVLWIVIAMLGFGVYYKKQRTGSMKTSEEFFRAEPEWQPNYDIVIQPRR